MNRIFLIPGLGADCRIYNRLHLDGSEITRIEWIVPAPTDTFNGSVTDFQGETEDLVN